MSATATETLGVALAKRLGDYGVDTIFGIPGVHTLELYRGLDQGRMRHVSARHEGSLGFMADGYARVSGKVGVCFVITGPGLTNISTAMGQAYACSIPMLVISAVGAQRGLGMGEGRLHELKRQTTLAEGVAAFSLSLSHPDQLETALARAFAVFDGARPRPVHIEIPLNLLSAEVAVREPRACPLRLKRPSPSPADLDLAAERLRAAKRPLIIAGGGAVGAARPIQTLAEALAAPVLMTINGRGILPLDHPLAVSWSGSLAAVRRTIADSDLVLALGTELGPTDFDIYADGGFSLAPELIRVDIDPDQMVRNRVPDLGILGDVALATQGLVKRLKHHAPRALDGGQARVAVTDANALSELSADMIVELAFLQDLRRAAPDAIFVGDSTQQVYAGNLGFAVHQPGQWFNSSVGFGALGYGLPAAVGAALAAPDRPIVCLCGDGGLQFSLAELAAAKETNAHIILILLNNGGYGEIKASMVAEGVTPVGVDLYTPDFIAVAKAYGWQAERLSDRRQIGQSMAAALARKGQTLIEIGPPDLT